MKTYSFTGLVQRTVVDTVSLTVEAKSETEALLKAESVLLLFPEPHEETGVKYCYIDNRDQKDVRILDIQEEVEELGIA